jgi:hypothetical protein
MAETDYTRTRDNLHRPDPDTFAREIPIYGNLGRFAVLEGDEKAAYAECVQDYIQLYQPVGILERDLVGMIADNAWRANRASVEEQRLLSDIDSGKDVEGRGSGRMKAYSASRERAMFRVIYELRLIQDDRRAPNPQPFVLSECQTWLTYERFLHPLNPIFNVR